MRSTKPTTNRKHCIHCNKPIKEEEDRKYKSGTPLNQHIHCYNKKQRAYAKEYRANNKGQITTKQRQRQEAKRASNKRDRAEDGKFLPKVQRVFDHSKDEDLIANFLKKNQVTKIPHKEINVQPYSGDPVPTGSSIAHAPNGDRIYQHLNKSTANIDITMLDY